MTVQFRFSEFTDDRFSRFLQFYERHPECYRLFRRFALDAKRAGFQRIGARLIVERIRWEKCIARDDGAEFKVNDHHIPFLARLLMAREPDRFDGFFATKHGFETSNEELLAECNRIDRSRHETVPF